MIEFYMKAAGVTFERRQRTLSWLKAGDKLIFIAEPSNIFDSSAVRIETEDGIQVGYIPRDKNATIFQNIIRHQGLYRVEVSAITGGGFDTNYGVNMLVRYFPDAENLSVRTDNTSKPKLEPKKPAIQQNPVKTCPLCALPVEEGAKKCANCGFSFEESIRQTPASKPVLFAELCAEGKCPECGGLMQEKYLACQECGFPKKLLFQRVEGEPSEIVLILKYSK